MREFNPNQKHNTSKHTVKSNHTLSIRKKRDTPKTHFALNRTTFSDSSLSISCSANYRLALFHSLFLFLSLSLSLWLLQSFRIGNFCVGFTSLILIYIVSFHLLLLDDSFFIRCCCCISLIAIAHLSNFHMCTNGNQNITRGWKWKRSQIFDHDHYFVVFHSFSLPPSLWISLLTLHIFSSTFLYWFSQIPQFISKNDAFTLCWCVLRPNKREKVSMLYGFIATNHIEITALISAAITALCFNLLYFAILMKFSCWNDTKCSFSNTFASVHSGILNGFV